MTVNVTSSVPRTEFRGISAEQQTALAMPVENLPIHLPLFFTLAPWGDTNKSYYVDQDAVSLLFGADTLNPLTQFFTHQSQFLRSTLTGGGRALLQRVTAPNASSSNFRLAIDRVQDDLPVYERNADRSFKRDAEGNKIDTGEVIAGTRIQLRMVPISTLPETGELTYGTASPAEGNMVSIKTGDVSIQTPVMDMVARCKGKGGRLRGLKMWAPTGTADVNANPDLNEKLGAFTYRFQFIERSSENSTARLKRTVAGEDGVSISFKKNTIDTDTKIQYYAGKVIKPAYEAANPADFTQYGPFEKMHVYDEALQVILKELADAEAAHTGVEIADPNLINFISGVDVDGIPYETFVVEGPSAGGVLFTELSNHFMTGGSDGDIGQAAFNTVVDELLDGLADSAIPFRNIARMPYSAVFDTGFPVATKLKFSSFLGLRPDVMVHVCTQDILRPLNTPAQDTSIGVTLRSHFRATQESAEFGTQALRVAVMANAGYLINDDYDGIVPFLEFLAVKMAEYAGAEGGSFASENAFGRGEQNVITRYRDHNVGDKLIEAKNADWDNGLNYAEWYDMSRLFWPGIQSIFENHTSILHGYLNTYIACNLTRIGHITWRELSGDSQFDDDQFLAEVVKRVNQRATTDKYDGRVNITPNAYYSAQDERLGTAWHLDIGMAGDNIRTVEHLAIIAQPRRVSEDT